MPIISGFTRNKPGSRAKRGATSSFLIAIVHLEVTLQKGTDVLPKAEEGPALIGITPPAAFANVLGIPWASSQPCSLNS
jgi:hypothetical protein